MLTGSKFYTITWASQVLSFVLMTSLSKLQDAEVFGFSTFSFLVLGLVVRLNEIGINEYYLIRGNLSDLSTLYFLNVLKGLLVGSAVALSILQFALGVRESSLFLILALVFVIDGLKNPMIYHQYKLGNPLPMVYTERGAYLLAGVVALFLAFVYEAGPYIVCLWFVLYAVFQLAISYVATGVWKPSLHGLNLTYAKQTIAYIMSIFAFICITYALRQGPEFIVRNDFGYESLGRFFYTLLVTLMPLNVLVYPFVKFMMPRLVDEVHKADDYQLIQIFGLFGIVMLATIVIEYAFLPMLVDLFGINSFLHPLFYPALVLMYIRSFSALFVAYYKAKLRQWLYNKLVGIELILLTTLYLWNGLDSLDDALVFIIVCQLFTLVAAIILDTSLVRVLKKTLTTLILFRFKLRSSLKLFA